MSEEMNSEVARNQDDGQITYATEVISTIVSVATTEVEGISGIIGGGSISGILGKGRAPRGVKVDVNGNRVTVDISVAVDYGIPIQKVGRNCQENVRKSIETMTGLNVERVDLHVVSVSFEKENQELQQSQKLALRLEEAEEKAEDTAEEAKAEEVVPETEVVETVETPNSADLSEEAPAQFEVEIVEEEEAPAGADGTEPSDEENSATTEEEPEEA